MYLRGRYLLNKRTPDSIQKGRILFEKAVAKDPRFALGHAGIADSYILLGKIGELTGDEAATRAWPEVSAALALDENLAEGYISRATLLADFDWNWPAGEADFQKALELNSNSAIAHHWYARHLAEIGRSEEALKEISAAEKLDPLSLHFAQKRRRFYARRTAMLKRSINATGPLISKAISAEPFPFSRRPTSIINSIRRGN